MEKRLRIHRSFLPSFYRVPRPPAERIHLQQLYCVYTPAQEILLREWFVLSLADGYELMATPLSICGAGYFTTT